MKNQNFAQNGFLLTQNQKALSCYDKLLVFDEWDLHYSSTLRLCVLKSSIDREIVGWIIGFPIHVDLDLFCPDELLIDGKTADTLNPSDFSKFLFTLGGRFFAIYRNKNDLLIYPDASGSLSILYSIHIPLAASSPDLFEDFPLASPDIRENLQYLRQNSGFIYPLGLSDLEGVQVLTPNHCLDLKSWTVKRFWPNTTFEKQNLVQIKNTTNIQYHRFERAVKIIRNSILLIAKEWNVCLNLTSGRDSRMLLATILDVANNFYFQTNYKDNVEDVDFLVANILAKTYSLKLDYKFPDIGNIALIQGLAGEVGRAFYWKKEDFITQSSLNSEILLERMSMTNAHPLCKQRMESWLQELQYLDKFFILDLLYIEHRLGYVMGPAMYLHESNENNVNFACYVMNQHELFEIMLSFPEVFRFKNGFYEGIIATSSPELRFFPLHKSSYTGWEKYYLGWQLKYRKQQSPPNSELLYTTFNQNRSLINILAKDLQKIILKLVNIF